MIDALNPLLTNNIDLDNNILGERQTVSLSHGEPVLIRLRTLTAIPRLVRVGYAEGYVGVGAITTYNTDGTFYVTVYFQDSVLPTAAVTSILYFEP